MTSIDTVNDLPTRVQYVASAAQTNFPYPFPIFQAADLVFDVDGVVAALDVDYSVSGEGDDLGGDVTWGGAAFAGGELVTVYRDISIDRDTDISQNGPWSSSAYNNEQDKIFLIMQQLAAQLRRSLRLPTNAAVDDADLELLVANFANKILTFDSDGKPTPAELVEGIITAEIIGSLLYPRTTQEVSQGVTPTNYRYPAGHVWRYCSATQIANILSATTQNVAGPIQNAVDCTTGDVYFPTGTYYIGAPIYIRSTSFVNIRFVGESRTSTYIYPNAVNIQDANGVNALFINQQDNGKVSWYRLRLSSGGGIAWTGVCISATNGGLASQKVIFSGEMNDCWFDPGSTNGGFFNGGLINYVVSNCTFEFLKGCFNLSSVSSDVHFSNNAMSNCYDYFVQSTFADNGVIHITGLNCYTHNRGFLVVATSTYDLRMVSIGLQAAVVNLGTVGLASLTSCSAFLIDACTVNGNAVSTSTATGGTTTTVLTDSTLSLTINAYAGYTLYNSTRATSKTIVSNTATTITTAAIAGQVSGDVYQILWPSTGLPVGLGPLATVVKLDSSRGTISNSRIRGATIGLLMDGTGAVDVSISNVSILNSLTAAYRHESTGGTGAVRISASDFSESLLHLVTFFNVAAYDFLVTDTRFMNAGLGGNSGARNLGLATSGMIRLNGCMVGQNTALAAASHYFSNATAGSCIATHPEIVGTPPTALKTGAQTITFIYKPLWGSAVYDPPSLLDGAGTTTTVTVTGAALGDFADSSFSLSVQGITVTQYVSAANTVTVRFQNETTGTLDLASGTLAVKTQQVVTL